MFAGYVALRNMQPQAWSWFWYVSSCHFLLCVIFEQLTNTSELIAFFEKKNSIFKISFLCYCLIRHLIFSMIVRDNHKYLWKGNILLH